MSLSTKTTEASNFRDGLSVLPVDRLGLIGSVVGRPAVRLPRRVRAGLVADALKMAAATRGSLAGAVFHSDHGAQYTSREFTELCEQLGVTRSMGAAGTSADNAACESFHAPLKRETLKGGRPLARGSGMPSGDLLMAHALQHLAQAPGKRPPQFR